jgi:pyridoxal phosphate enzyme (YggS family)
LNPSLEAGLLSTKFKKTFLPMSITTNLHEIKASLPDDVKLVAVSKTMPVDALQEAYEAGQRIFGENRIQEMQEKQMQLPDDVEWHMIGHVQTNKIRFMAPFVHMVHGCDSLKMLAEINKEAKKNNRIISCLLQVHIAQESTKFGFTADEVIKLVETREIFEFSNLKIVGLMGMATNTSDQEIVRSEFRKLKKLSEFCVGLRPQMNEVSMGMSGDYKLAIDCGSTMVRIGSSIFGSRPF